MSLRTPRITSGSIYISGPNGDPAIHAIGDPIPSALEVITPEIASSPKSAQIFGDGTNDIFYLRTTVNPGSDVLAGQRLYEGHDYVDQLMPGQDYEIYADSAITSVYILAIGDVSGTVASADQVVEKNDSSHTPDTQAEHQTAMVRFDFDSADNVRKVSISVSDRWSAGTAGAPIATANHVTVQVKGYKYEV